MFLIVAPVAINVQKPNQSPSSTDIFGSTPTTPPTDNTSIINGVITNSSTPIVGKLNSSTTMNVSNCFVPVALQLIILAGY